MLAVFGRIDPQSAKINHLRQRHGLRQARPARGMRDFPTLMPQGGIENANGHLRRWQPRDRTSGTSRIVLNLPPVNALGSRHIREARCASLRNLRCAKVVDTIENGR
jgi:hypothetical protein